MSSVSWEWIGMSKQLLLCIIPNNYEVLLVSVFEHCRGHTAFASAQLTGCQPSVANDGCRADQSKNNFPLLSCGHDETKSMLIIFHIPHMSQYLESGSVGRVRR